MKTTFGILFIGLIVLAACSSTGQPSAASATAPASPQLVTTATALPTPSSPGNMVVWENLQVTMDRSEVTQDYLTEYGSTRIPPAGQKFLWVHVRLKNVGHIEMDVLGSEHFSVLYAGAELKPTYGHRMDYVDYTALGPVIFPDQELDAWLRFDIPTAAELKDLRFVFLPASAQVGVSPSSPNYPYTEDKPTYVWKCGL
jgi:uncharacterized protein DUF4352